MEQKQDCDLEEHVEGTLQIYSIRNTPEPLTLKVRDIPCLCDSCISDTGDECQNSAYADQWRLVHLVPKKKDNIRKHAKRKLPDNQVQHPNNMQDERDIGVNQMNGNCSDSSTKGNENEVQVDVRSEEISEEKRKEGNVIEKSVTDNSSDPFVTDDVTDDIRIHSLESHQFSNAFDSDSSELPDIVADDSSCTKRRIARNLFDGSTEEILGEDDVDYPNETAQDVLHACAMGSEEVCLAGENTITCTVTPQIQPTDGLDDIPEEIFWESILSRMSNCRHYGELENFVRELDSRDLPPIPERTYPVYSTEFHARDLVAQLEIPEQYCPDNVTAVKTDGDGNCLPRSVSTSMFGHDGHHLMIRAHIVMEGVRNKKNT